MQSLQPRILISRKQTIAYLAIAQRLLLNISAGCPGKLKSTVSIYWIYPQSLQRAAPTGSTCAELDQIVSTRIRCKRAAACCQVRCIWRHLSSPLHCSCFARRNLRVKFSDHTPLLKQQSIARQQCEIWPVQALYEQREQENRACRQKIPGTLCCALEAARKQYWLQMLINQS